jgi:hypothetical protein
MKSERGYHSEYLQRCVLFLHPWLLASCVLLALTGLSFGAARCRNCSGAGLVIEECGGHYDVRSDWLCKTTLRSNRSQWEGCNPARQDAFRGVKTRLHVTRVALS